MLVLERQASDPRTGARCAIRDALEPSYRLRLVETDGVTWDERLSNPADEPWVGDAARATLVAPLAGIVHVDIGAGPRLLAPGDVLLGELGQIEMRFEPGARVLMLDWTEGSIGTRSAEAGRVARRTLARVTHALTSTAFTTNLRDLLAVLQAEGIPLFPGTVGELAAGPRVDDAVVAAALSTVFSGLESAPLAVDLERHLTRSRRSIVSLVNGFAARYDLDALSFRALHRRWRVMAGSALMTHPDARTEEVARRVGYGSARAFCHAFANAGLPSPGALRKHL